MCSDHCETWWHTCDAITIPAHRPHERELNRCGVKFVRRMPLRFDSIFHWEWGILSSAWPVPRSSWAVLSTKLNKLTLSTCVTFGHQMSCYLPLIFLFWSYHSWFWKKQNHHRIFERLSFWNYNFQNSSPRAIVFWPPSWVSANKLGASSWCLETFSHCITLSIWKSGLLGTQLMSSYPFQCIKQQTASVSNNCCYNVTKLVVRPILVELRLVVARNWELCIPVIMTSVIQ